MFHQDELISTLRSIPWFVDLTPQQVEQLGRVASICQLKTGEEIFHEGDRIENLIVLLEGQLALEIFVPGRGSLRTMTAEPLDVVGWSSMTPVVRARTATVKAICPSRMISFHAESLRKLCDEDHDLGFVIMKRIANITASRLLTTRLMLLNLWADRPISVWQNNAVE